MTNTIGERARQAGMSVPQMLKVYAASGHQLNVALGPDELRLFARFIENGARIEPAPVEELRRQVTQYQDMLRDLRDEARVSDANRRATLRHRRISLISAIASVAATLTWIAWFSMTM